MGLQQYSKKRNFKNTPEPKGKKITAHKTLEFVVQRHNASHLHYDFRLEMEGVMKSWAVPKGPSMNPQDKRLAMMVEDHPFDYRKFEGIIPEGNYGAGTVEIWDKGTYTPIDESNSNAEKELMKGLKSGNLKFVMNGNKLKGEFALVKLKNDEKQKNAWLLIKHRDNYATDKNYTSEDYPSLTVLKGKKFSKKDKATTKKETAQKTKTSTESKPVRPSRFSKKKHLTDYIRPMLAKETDQPFDNEEWIFEIKWDGYRAIAETGKALKFYSRNGISFIDQYPEISEELQKIKTRFIIDGEVTALDDDGIPDFQLLQNFDPEKSTLVYYVFDILQNGAKDLTGLPLIERKSILRKEFQFNDRIRYSDHVAGNGKQFFELVRKRKMEGIMAKDGTSSYNAGTRTGNWLKIKNHEGQEAVIAGFTSPRKSRKYFGALVLGIYEGKEFKYAGHTGTGFTEESLKDVYEKLQPLIRKDSPFKQRVKTNMPVTWVKPELVANLKFSNWTADHLMRHPVFMGLREDKDAKEVINEDKRKIKKPAGEIASSEAKNESPSQKKRIMKKTSGKKTAKKEGSDKDEEELKLDGRRVPVTHFKKIYFPEDKITKGDIINYYQSVADYILPYLKDRPQSLLRNPNGISDVGFFHKDAGDQAPSWVKSKKIFSESANKDIDYIICNDRATLAYLNNLGCIELNPWHSRVSALDNPDYLAIDLDPSPKNTFEQVIQTALAVKEVFDKAGADCYCKTSGASGLHIYVPAGGKYTYEEVKNFANIIAIMVTEKLPKFTSVIRPLQKRGDKIYVDFLQNRRGQTLASVYSVRPKAGATVSVPLQWKEVKKGLHPSQFTIHTVLKRLKKSGDLFKGVLGKGIDMEKCLRKLNG